MKICLLAEATTSPVLTSALSILGERHAVQHCDPGDPAASADARHHADLYLLKSRQPAARTLAEAAQQSGALVINTPSATAAALDRAVMSALLAGAGVPVPATRVFTSLREFAEGHCDAYSPWPVVVKSQRSRRGDLVARVAGPAALAALLPVWADEPVIVQEYLRSDGHDFKFWVVGTAITLARRPSALDIRTTAHDVALDLSTVPGEWTSLVLSAGSALGLDVFGVDGILTDDRLVVVDVNPFPGFRSATGAGRALVDLVERRLAEAG